ncbi:MAG: hypothetical protein GY711_19550 [bacterium]|nr:hypothetical protein [bacterium]
MIALLLALCGSPAQDGDRWFPARVVLEGPTEGVRLELGPAGATRIESVLLAGERRTVRVPFASGPREPGAPASTPPEVPGARFEGWEPRSGDWAALPAGLRIRSRPVPASERTPGAGLATLSLLVAGGALALGLRRRPALALAAGGLAALAATGVELRRDDAAPRPVRVLEGDAEAESWLAVTAATGELELPADVFRVETDPVRVELEYSVALDGAGERSVRARASRARIVAFEPFEPGLRRLHSELNAWAACAAAWTREPGEEWVGHGAWGLGERLPGADPLAAAPPGWAVAGLPQGRRVLLALAGEAPPEWVRLVGFE